MYHDSNSEPWKIEKKWEDLTPKEWVEVRTRNLELVFLYNSYI